MAVLQQDIDIFINQAQQKIVEFGTIIRENKEVSEPYEVEYEAILKLEAAVALFQNAPFTLPDDVIYSIIHKYDRRYELTLLPVAVFNNTGADSTLVFGTTLKGETGSTGEDGKSAYNVALDNGFVGTVEEWLASLNGTDGEDGDNGWNPLFAIEDYNGGKIVKIVGWSGGTGTEPNSPVYAGPTGYVADPSQAVNIKGDTGAKGDTGTPGTHGLNGWSPIWSLVDNASDEKVVRVTDWAGGTGTKPDVNIYLGAGGFVTDIADAIVISGEKGDQGDPFIIDAKGNITGRNSYNSESEGFSYLDVDSGLIYFKLSATPGDWSDGIQFSGYKGWSPQLSIIESGDKKALQISGWIGGEGDAPTTYVGKYIGGAGLVDDIEDAENIVGPKTPFTIDQEGDLAGRDTYDDEAKGYTYFDNENGNIYIKNSVTNADWGGPYQWIGPAGPTGPTGESGEGLSDAVRVASTANFASTYSSGVLTASANGSLSIDGVAVSDGDRVLLKDQTTATQNGPFIVTDKGDGSNPAVLTRAIDFSSDLHANKFVGVHVKEGTANGGKYFGLDVSRGDIELDTTDLSFKVVPKPFFSASNLYSESSSANYSLKTYIVQNRFIAVLDILDADANFTITDFIPGGIASRIDPDYWQEIVITNSDTEIITHRYELDKLTTNTGPEYVFTGQMEAVGESKRLNLRDITNAEYNIDANILPDISVDGIDLECNPAAVTVSYTGTVQTQILFYADLLNLL